jgi:hypothetical protein
MFVEEEVRADLAMVVAMYSREVIKWSGDQSASCMSVDSVSFRRSQ